MSEQKTSSREHVLSVVRMVDLNLTDERLDALVNSYTRFRAEMTKLYAHDVGAIEPPVVHVADRGADDPSDQG